MTFACYWREFTDVLGAGLSRHRVDTVKASDRPLHRSWLRAVSTRWVERKVSGTPSSDLVDIYEPR